MKRMNCLICNETSALRFLTVDDKTYWKCEQCLLVFLDPKFRLSPSEERFRYQQHNNDIHDEYYRLFLSKLFNPIKENLKSGVRGLTLCGSIMVAYAHFRNYQTCKKADCSCHEIENL